MPSVRFNEKTYDMPEPDSWTTGEISEAEHALGCSFDGASRGDSMAISIYIAVRREDKQIPPVVLADSVKQVPMSALEAEEEEEGPLVETPFGPERQENGGPPPLDPSESLSASKI